MSTERRSLFSVRCPNIANSFTGSKPNRPRGPVPGRSQCPLIGCLAMILVMTTTHPAAAQTTWYVNLANCPGSGSGAEADPFCKIQHGIDAASDGDTVLIADGTYTGVNNKNLSFNGKAITVKSQNGPENCIIDCEHAGRGFLFGSGETDASVLVGVAIIRGRVSGPGGGIYCLSSSPRIIGCRISECEASGVGPNSHGGGLYFSSGGAPMIVSDCEISNNFAANLGGGVYSAPGSAQISIIGCDIWGNISVQGGGGMTLAGGSVEISGCNFWDNVAAEALGGALLLYGESAEISGCNLWGNRAWTSGGGIYGALSGAVSVVGSEIWDNTSGQGGGLWFGGGVLQITGCSIWANFAAEGGGAHVQDCSVSSVIQDCLIEGNQAGIGGGLSIWGNLEVLRCTVYGNIAQYGGGGIHGVNGEGTLAIDGCRIQENFSSESGGGIELINIYPYPATIRNSMIVDNAAVYTGAGVRIVSGGYCPSIVGCTIASNEVLAPGYAGGGGISYSANSNAACAINDSILWNDAATPGDEVSLSSDYITLSVAHSDVAGGQSQVFVGGNSSVAWGPGNIDQDPLFANPLAGDYHLTPDSLCIDAGDPAFVPDSGETDVDGEDRVGHDIVDMGADEYHDCNDNGVADYLDLLKGSSSDCNATSVPDECERFICDDQDACTDDSCEASGECVFVPIDCDDSDVCTDDQCDPKSGCSHVPVECEALGECTTAICVAELGCVYPPVVCDDGDACTTDDCGPGVGCIYTLIVCDDQDACTMDSCEPGAGCQFTPVQCPNGQTCDPDAGACVAFCQTDLNGSGETDAADLALLLGAWGPNPGHAADFNHDEAVNAADLASLLGNWGACL